MGLVSGRKVSSIQYPVFFNFDDDADYTAKDDVDLQSGLDADQAGLTNGFSVGQETNHW